MKSVALPEPPDTVTVTAAPLLVAVTPEPTKSIEVAAVVLSVPSSLIVNELPASAQVLSPRRNLVLLAVPLADNSSNPIVSLSIVQVAPELDTVISPLSPSDTAGPAGPVAPVAPVAP